MTSLFIDLNNNNRTRYLQLSIATQCVGTAYIVARAPHRPRGTVVQRALCMSPRDLARFRSPVPTHPSTCIPVRMYYIFRSDFRRIARFSADRNAPRDPRRANLWPLNRRNNKNENLITHISQLSRVAVFLTLIYARTHTHIYMCVYNFVSFVNIIIICTCVCVCT